MSDSLRKFVEDEQMLLWDDLDKAIRYSVNGIWSIQATAVAGRIVDAARLVGPTPWERIQWPLLAGGVYAKLLTLAGLEVPAVDWERLETRMESHGGTREFLTSGYAATLDAITEDSGTILAVTDYS